jgi:hypothetical protein
MFHGRQLLSQCFKELHRLARDASIRRQDSVNPGKECSFRSISVSRDDRRRRRILEGEFSGVASCYAGKSVVRYSR